MWHAYSDWHAVLIDSSRARSSLFSCGRKENEKNSQARTCYSIMTFIIILIRVCVDVTNMASVILILRSMLYDIYSLISANNVINFDDISMVAATEWNFHINIKFSLAEMSRMRVYVRSVYLSHI